MTNLSNVFFDQRSEKISKVVFDHQAKTFQINVGVDEKNIFYINYGYKGYQQDSALIAYVKVLDHPTHSESDVKKIKINTYDNTVGWLCTIRALTSDQHQYADSEYFRQAAFTAVNLILMQGIFNEVPHISENETLNLSDFFDEECSVLILHKPSLAKHEITLDEDLTELLPVLHQYGFNPITRMAGQNNSIGNASLNFFSTSGEYLKLKTFSKDIGFTDFISKFFNELLPSASTSLLKFFLYYQLIETLSARIFNHCQTHTITSLFDVKDNPVKVHPLIDKLKKDASEKHRINLLFNNYTDCMSQMGDLMQICNDFLRVSGYDEETSIAEAIYKVRNSIFHDLRGIPKEAMPIIDEIVNHMRLCMPALMITFKLP